LDCVRIADKTSDRRRVTTDTCPGSDQIETVTYEVKEEKTIRLRTRLRRDK